MTRPQRTTPADVPTHHWIVGTAADRCCEADLAPTLSGVRLATVCW